MRNPSNEAVYSPVYVTHMKIISQIFPSVNWISINLVVALEQSLICQSKKSHAQVSTNDICQSKSVVPKTGWDSQAPGELAENGDIWGPQGHI